MNTNPRRNIIMKKIALFGAFVLLSLAVATVGGTPASADDTPRIRVSWVLPSQYGPNTTEADLIAISGSQALFPQARGEATCGRWAQVDFYLADQAAVDALGGTLEWVNGRPEDSSLYVRHQWKYGGDCVPVKPETKVEFTDWQDGEFVCNDSSVTQTRSKSVTEFALVDNKWVAGTPIVTSESQTRELTDEEVQSCQPETKVETSDWKDGKFGCGDTTVEQTRTVTTTNFILGEGSTFVAEAPVVVTESRKRDLGSEEQVPCPTTPPVTTQPPPPVTTVPTPPVTVPTPPVTVPAPVVTVPVVETSTVAPPVTTAPVPVPALTSLPETGTNSTGWVIGVALILIALGGLTLGTVRFSRRR